MLTSANYPGGNICCVGKSREEILVSQELRGTSRWWFYWNMQWKNPSDDQISVKFRFANGKVVGPWRPALGKDGRTWRFLGGTGEMSEEFEYTFAPREKVYFAYAFPYQSRDFEHFCRQYPAVKRRVLTSSEAGRPVDLLRLGNPQAEYHVFFTARAHACEASASYVLEGTIAALLKQPRVLERYCFHIVPFLDIDGVEAGDQGKDRSPHDHYLDYIPSPVYRSTAALMDYAVAFKGKTAVYIDFHSPYLMNLYPFFVLRCPAGEDPISRLATILEEVTDRNLQTGGIRYEKRYNAEPAGELGDWRHPDTPTGSKFFADCGAVLSTTFEMPYYGPPKVE